MNTILQSHWLTVALGILYAMLWVLFFVIFIRKTRRK